MPGVLHISQEAINIGLAVLIAVMPVITLLIQKLFSQKKDVAEYSSELLQITNDATEALRKAREELTATQESHEKTIDTIRREHEAAMKSLRSEYDGKHERLKGRIAELEKVQKIYAVQFDLVTHPNVEIRNISARAMDDLTESQKTKTIPPAPPKPAP